MERRPHRNAAHQVAHQRSLKRRLLTTSITPHGARRNPEEYGILEEDIELDETYKTPTVPPDYYTEEKKRLVKRRELQV